MGSIREMSVCQGALQISHVVLRAHAVYEDTLVNAVAAVHGGVFVDCCAGCSCDAVRVYDGGLVLRELSLRRRAVCLRVWLSVCLFQIAFARFVLFTRASS